MEIIPGAIVEITGKLGSFKHSRETRLAPLNFRKPQKVLVLGKSMRHAGKTEIDEYGWRHMISWTEDKHVWIVMPLAGNQYRKPFAVLPEQIVTE